MRAWDGCTTAKGSPMSSLQTIPFRTIEHEKAAMHAFGGFPYLVTWIAQGLHHVLLLPALEEPSLLEAARAQWTANRLRTCLCLDWEGSVFFDQNHDQAPKDHVPYAALTLTGLLRLTPIRHEQPWPDGRAEQLAQFIETVGFPPVAALCSGYSRLEASLEHGREASREELESLSGRGPTGAPFGLFRCETCRAYRGTCLDPAPDRKGLIVQVICLCVNETRCAACGEPFCRFQLESNLYHAEEDTVWHVSAMPALEHRCRADRA